MFAPPHPSMTGGGGSGGEGVFAPPHPSMTGGGGSGGEGVFAPASRVWNNAK